MAACTFKCHQGVFQAGTDFAYSVAHRDTCIRQEYLGGGLAVERHLGNAPYLIAVFLPIYQYMCQLAFTGFTGTDKYIRVFPVTDPGLFPVDNPVITIADSACLDRGHVRAHIRLGDTHADKQLTPQQAGKVLFFDVLRRRIDQQVDLLEHSEARYQEHDLELWPAIGALAVALFDELVEHDLFAGHLAQADEVQHCFDTNKIWRITAEGEIKFFRKCTSQGIQTFQRKEAPVVIPTYAASGIVEDAFVEIRGDAVNETASGVRLGYPVVAYEDGDRDELVNFYGFPVD